MKKKIDILFEVFSDEENVNAQSLNAREIALRLDPELFRSSFLVGRKPDPRLLGKSHIRLISLPPRLRSLFVKMYLLCSYNDILVYPNDLFHTPLFSKLIKESIGRKKVVFPLEMPIGFIKFENPQTFRNMRRILKQCHLVVPNSAYAARILKNEMGMEASTIIPVGVDTHFFLPIERGTSSTIRVLFAGRLIERKGPDKVLEAAHVFPNVVFRIIGSSYGKEDGIYADELRQHVRNHNLKNVEFIGKVSQKQLRQFMWESDILLHPSMVESMPKVTLEAAATGLPCIVYDHYGTPSVLEGITGFQVKNFAEMLTRLQSLIESRDLRLRLGAAATHHAKQFDWNIVAKQWERALLEVVQC